MLARNSKLVSDLVQALITVIEQDDLDGTLAKFLGVRHLSNDQIDILKGLSEKEKRRLIQSGQNLVNITINRRNVDALCTLLKDNKARDHLIQKLVIALAPQTMMYDYFGVSVKEMASLRRKYGVNGTGGRPVSLTEDEEARVYSLYKLDECRYKLSCLQYADAVLCLRIHEKTGIPIAGIYKFILEMANV